MPAAAYFGAFPDAPALGIAAAWVGIVVLLDLVVVAGLVMRSLAMFQSPLGTRIPFALIFLSVLAVGGIRSNRRHAATHRIA